MSKSIFEVNWDSGFDQGRIMVSANSKDTFINVGIKDCTVDRAAWFELNQDQQIELVTAILENLKSKGVLK